MATAGKRQKNTDSRKGEELFQADYSRGTGSKEMKLNIILHIADSESLESLLLLRETKPLSLKDCIMQKWASSAKG